ncbi:MAG: hypothetical protein JWQ40_2756 [Segetibacter sp.]|nr:hypothetical protein [Segetibacter sp.]
MSSFRLSKNISTKKSFNSDPIWEIEANGEHNLENSAKEKVLFVTNKLFVDESKPEGGVRLCTYDFINLLKCRYEVVIYSLEFNRTLTYRIKAKIGLDVYEDYDLNKYATLLKDKIAKHSIQKVFINLSNATAISKVIKKHNGENVKVILCSHGNESGDFLHQTVRFSQYMAPLPRFFSAWRLGRVLQKEVEFRTRYLDMVLNVSPIEESIEKWLGVNETYMVPRVYAPDFINWNPTEGKIGFLSDLSHYPNYNGLLQLCKALAAAKPSKSVQIRVVGKRGRNLDNLMSQYDFISPTGYLTDDELKVEAASWMYYLNLVFYYSKGVSTKLAKGMNWGLPVLSTEAGNRGYVFKNGGVVTCDSPSHMAEVIVNRAFDKGAACKDRAEVIKAVEAYADMNEVMIELYPKIENL